jgi:hypothetical protein
MMLLDNQAIAELLHVLSKFFATIYAHITYVTIMRFLLEHAISEAWILFIFVHAMHLEMRNTTSFSYKCYGG